MVFLYTTLSLSFYKDVKPVLVLLLWITNQGWHFIAVTLRWCMSPNPDSGIRVVMAETRNFAKHWKCAVWKLKKKKKHCPVFLPSAFSSCQTNIRQLLKTTPALSLYFSWFLNCIYIFSQCDKKTALSCFLLYFLKHVIFLFFCLYFFPTRFNTRSSH